MSQTILSRQSFTSEYHFSVIIKRYRIHCSCCSPSCRHSRLCIAPSSSRVCITKHNIEERKWLFFFKESVICKFCKSCILFFKSPADREKRKMGNQRISILSSSIITWKTNKQKQKKSHRVAYFCGSSLSDFTTWWFLIILGYCQGYSVMCHFLFPSFFVKHGRHVFRKK